MAEEQQKPDWRTPIEAILAAAKGAEQKIAEILSIARRAARRSLDRDQADDIAQEIAIKAWEQLQEKPESIDFSQPLPPLVHIWVGRTIVDRLRSDRRCFERVRRSPESEKIRKRVASRGCQGKRMRRIREQYSCLAKQD